MSINLNIPGFNPNTLSLMNPVSSLTTGLGSVANTAQSGIMQTLSQLFSSLSQMFSTGGQNGQFQANLGSQNIGNTLGQGQLMGNQAFNMGNSFGQPQQLGNSFGQPQQPINITINTNGGQPQVQGSQTRDVGHCSSAQPMSTERAANVLNQNFDKVSGGAETFDRGDLRRVANDPNSSPELRQAARTVLNDPQAMNRLDTGDSRSRGGNEMADGRISKGDLTAVGGAVAPPQPMTTERASQVLNQNFNQVSGGAETFTRDDLSRVANDSSKSPELRQAAQFVLDNPGSMSKLDNADARFRGKNEATDGRISKGDVNAAATLSDWQ